MTFNLLGPRYRSAGQLAVCIAVLSGCWRTDAPKLVPVTGRVLHQGQGVTAGSIFLHPDATAEYTDDNPSAMLQTDGSFSLKTFPFGEGVAPGTYTATLAPELAQRLRQPNYGLVDKSPWKVTVPPEGISDLVLEVKK